MDTVSGGTSVGDTPPATPERRRESRLRQLVAFTWASVLAFFSPPAAAASAWATRVLAAFWKWLTLKLYKLRQHLPLFNKSPLHPT
ncbi:unnamed protein product [Cuscuta campestris]|uniref:Uncharacterized protein n=1 Tax=Cuscuta campestris TaxID=132261 RepID=A0A484L953_9ASTE|nr:unnamed protein product [Cuscuta campestris]